MANGKDSEEFGVTPKGRTRLKRELAFVLKAQAEISGCLGRTRSSKAQNDNGKRLKTAAESEAQNDDGDEKLGSEEMGEGENVKGLVDLEEEATSEDDARSDVVDLMSDDEPKSHEGESVLRDELKNGVVEMAVDDEPQNGCIGDSVIEDVPQEEELLKKTGLEKPLVGEEIPDFVENGGDKVEGEVIEKPLVDEELPVSIENGVKVETEKPQRRFTRSALKAKADEMKNLSGNSDAQQLNSEMQKSPFDCQSRFEMKMSKMMRKFGLPELLDTGILEGQPVKYIRGSKARGAGETGLRGVITGSSILCHCDSCKGTEVFTPPEFELHAGSSNKRPPDFIYLENGNTLRDVMIVCQNSPLETLEEAVRLVIGCSSLNKCTICLNCKESICDKGTRSSVILCSSCMELKESGAMPAVAANHSDESPNLVTVPKRLDTVLKCSSSKPVAVPKCPDTMSKCGSPKPVTAPKRPDTVPKYSSPKPVTVPKRPHTVPKCSSSESKSQGRVTRKDIGLHKKLFEEDVLPDGTEVAYYSGGKKMLVGYKKGPGIICSCCNAEVSPSQFEAHAGFMQRRKPYDFIYTSNGVSLHELAVSLSRSQKLSTKNNDDTCSKCWKGGDLLCCDTCPRAFHKECLSLPSVPGSPWYCNHCESMYEKEKHAVHNANAVAAGRVAGVDPIEQITNRCIRIVTTLEEKLGGCSLCRGHEFSGSDFGPGTVILCDQCEKEFHVGCLKDNGIEDLKEVPKGKWFCCSDCLRVHSALQKLVVHGEQKLPDSLLNVVRKKHNEKGPESGVDVDIKWRVLHGKMSTDDGSLQLLSKALSIFHDRFAPIIDPTSRLDFINEMLYGGTIQTQEFGGMYCAIITVNQLVVSAGLFRIYGTQVAELPLVATSADFQGQGYFQTLFSCIERFLAFLNVKSLVLPAADEAESIWKKRFGFQKLTQNEIHNYRKSYQMMIFQGTSMLHKSVPKCRVLS